MNNENNKGGSRLRKSSLKFLGGKVQVRVKGNDVTKIMNRLVQKNIKVSNIHTIGEQECTFWLHWENAVQLKRIKKGLDCKIYFMHKKGLPIVRRKMLYYVSFIVGAFISFMIFILLTNMTWGIVIEGADHQTEEQIIDELKQMGIEIGKMNKLKNRPEIVQANLQREIENLTWIGVDIKGTKIFLQAVQKNEPDKEVTENLGHLVAKKKAVISHYFVEKGETVVKKNQFVNKGDILVSGYIASNDDKKLIAAKGKVWGMTWYQSTVTYPLTMNYEVMTGQYETQYDLHIHKWTIPVWGFTNDLYREQTVEHTSIPLKIGKWELPFKINKKIVREKEILQKELTKDEAVEKAKQLARNDLLMKIPADSIIDKEFILHEQVESGKVNLSINFQVIEDIAMKKPIVQGEKE